VHTGNNLLSVTQIQGESTRSALEVKWIQAHKSSRGRASSLPRGNKDLLREKRVETLRDPSKFKYQEL
jgi:hypothetical protein